MGGRDKHASLNRQQRRAAKRAARGGARGSAGAAAVNALLKDAIDYHRNGHTEKAEPIYRSVIQAVPRHAEAWHLWGLLALQDGDGESAVERIDEAVSLDGEKPLFHFNLGNALRSLRRLEEAEASSRRATKLNREYIDALLNLGLVLREQGRVDDAVEILAKAAALAPDDADVLNSYGAVLVDCDRADAVIEILRSCLTKAPSDVRVQRNLASALAAQGEFDTAEKVFRSALQGIPGDGQIYLSLVGLGRRRAKDADVESMEGLLKDPSAGDDDRVRLHFSLARTQDQRGEEAAAFEHWRRGNEIRRGQTQWDIGDDEAMAERIIDSFAQAPDRSAPIRRKDPIPIFILGMPRSGTSLVEQILASHSAVHGAGELDEITRLAKALAHHGDVFPEAVPRLTEELLAEMATRYRDVLRRRGNGAQYVCDKAPGNFWYIGLIRHLLPDALIVHCRRDPVDTCLSCYKHLFAGQQPFAYDLNDLGHYYCVYHRVMRHWHGYWPHGIHDLQYEELVADQEAETRRLLAFCGLAWEENCLRFHETARTVRTASAEPVRRPIYADAIGGWRRQQSHLAPLLAALGPLAPR